MLLTVELTKPDKNPPTESEIMIYCDIEGLDLIIEELNKLRKHGNHGGHTHLMTPAWAGNELTETRIDEDNILMNHIKIILKPDDHDGRP